MKYVRKMQQPNLVQVIVDLQSTLIATQQRVISLLEEKQKTMSDFNAMIQAEAEQLRVKNAALEEAAKDNISADDPR